MTETIDVPSSQDELIDELRAWLESNWDPDVTVREWWKRLGEAGWSAPSLPANAYGRGLSRNDTVRVQQEITDFGALGAPAGLGLLLAAPTIATHGTPEQIEQYVSEIVTGAKAWCQLFSEPGAGSDLAGLTTRAVQDGDEWIVERSEGVDVRRPGRGPRHAHRADGSGTSRSTRASRGSPSTCTSPVSRYVRSGS